MPSARHQVCLTRTVGEKAEQLKERTRRFALSVCDLLRLLPYAEPGPTVRRQLAKSATSVAANYRATCRARSRAEFVAGLGVVVEEADESLFWLEFMGDAKLIETPLLAIQQQEARELVAILSASVGTARRNARP